MQQGRFTGLVDWGYAGVGDRYIDLVSCTSSVQRNLGPEWVPVFLKHYGVDDLDEEKINLYQAVRLSE